MSQYTRNRGRNRGEDASRYRREGGRGRSQRAAAGLRSYDYDTGRQGDWSRSGMYGRSGYDEDYADAGAISGWRDNGQASYLDRGTSRRRDSGSRGRAGRRDGHGGAIRQRGYDYDLPAFYGGAGVDDQPGFVGQSSLYDYFDYADQGMYDDTDFDYEPVWAYTEMWIVPGPFVGVGPQGYQRSDDRIEEELSERLMQHGMIDAGDIVVEVSDGEVTLSGTVDDRETKRLAEDIAENVFGVRDVNNQLHVSQTSQDGQSQRATSGRQRRGRSSRQRQEASQGDQGASQQSTGQQEQSVGASSTS